ncbi:MAG: hypothetical protein KKG33_12545 [candidate division Zixibacteria bacterium]|nr:hypothetical protein [candidate division Zixibacteria bacterium]MBU1469320.1 hypothetical protein [candidate division Zixibacteria bacterium]MBU2626380.1 hypothetical protein [candidate division Zixibacteria bacterium]
MSAVKTAYTLLILALAGSLVLVSCGRSVDPEPEPPDDLVDLQNQLAESPRDNEEAELMALWMVGKVVAYTRDYNRIVDALNIVRQTYSDSVPQLDSIQFAYPFQPSEIIVLVDSAARAKLRIGAYTDWDSLNSLFRVTDIDTTDLGISQQVQLSFLGRLNPDLLADSYWDLGQLRGGITGTGIYVNVGDQSNLYPWEVGTFMTFLLRRADGDCPAGCINSHFWYFRVSEGHAELVGDFEAEDGVPFPDWWDVANAGFCEYFHYRHGYCDGL